MKKDISRNANPHSHERRFIGSKREEGLAILLHDEAHHAKNVLRLSCGDTLTCIIPEEKKAYQSTILHIGKDEIQCSLEQEIDSSSESIVSHILIATTKPALNELMVEKLCELGVGTIFFYKAERSIAHEASDNKKERLSKIAITATKQCGRATLTDIQFFSDISSASAALPSTCTKVWASLAHPEALPRTLPAPLQSYALVIGPAGDFSPNEEHFLSNDSWLPLYLGNIRLREETAAIAAVCALHTIRL